MFERFTDRSRRAVVLAQEYARMQRADHIGPEHILLGLIKEGEGVGCLVLEELGVNVELKPEDGATTPGHIPFTPESKRVLEYSLREALQLGHSYIGTEHVLLGLFREGSIYQVLPNEELPTFKDVHAAVIKKLATYQTPEVKPDLPDPEPEPEVQHVVIRYSNSQAALFAAVLSSGYDTDEDVMQRAVAFLEWLEEQQRRP